MDLYVKQWHAAVYRLALTRPLPGSEIPMTRGLLIEAVAGEKIRVFSEAVVWPPEHESSLETMLTEFHTLSQITVHRPLRIQADWVSAIERWLSGLSLSPSLRFAVESAACTLLAQTMQVHPARLIHPRAGGSVPLNGLIDADRVADALHQAENLIREGYRCLKIKCGHLPWREAADLTQTLLSRFGDKILFRADINRRWSLEDALRWTERVGPLLEYVEEPCPDWRRLSEFHRRTHLPIALDETLTQIGFDAAKFIEGFDAAVIKPSRIGGMIAAWRLARQCRDRSIKVVISSCFESEVGLWHAAHLAAACGPNTHHGLDTWRWFSTPLCDPVLRPVKGQWDLITTPAPRPQPDRAAQWSWL